MGLWYKCDPNERTSLALLHGIHLPLCRIDFAPQVILSQIRHAKFRANQAVNIPLRNEQIKARYEAGETLNDLANAYGISHQRIWQIIRGRSK